MAFARINPHLFTTTNANKASIDTEFNIQTGWINVLDQRIDDVESKGIAGATDPRNAGKLPTTDGENINWIKLDLSYFQPKSLDGSVFVDASIPQRALGNISVGTDQLIDLSATHEKIALRAIKNINIDDNTILLPKLRRPSAGSPALVVGQNGSYNYAELSYLGAAKFLLPAVGDDGILKLYNLASLWYYSPVEYEGGKLRNQSTALAKLLSSDKNTILVGKTDTSVGELDCSKGVLSVVVNGDVPSFTPIADVINNDPQATGKINGNNLLPNSVDFRAINPANNPLGNVKFFDAGFQSNNNNHDFYLLKKFTAVWNGTGTYDFTVIGDYRTDYWMPFVTFDNTLYNYYVSGRTKYSFRLNVTNNAGNIPTDAVFSIMILGYQ